MSRISLNKTQWSKIQPHLSGRAATGRPLPMTSGLSKPFFLSWRQGVDGAIFPRNTAVMSRHGEDIGDGHKMEPLPVYGTCSFLSLNSKENLISKNVHWMARLYEQKGGPTSRQNLWRFNQQAPCRRRWERVTAGSGAVRRAVPRRYPCPCRCGKYPDRLPAPPSTRPGCG